MRASRWQSFSPVWNQLHQFQNEMNRLFDRWSVGSPLSGVVAFPAVNVWEEGEQVCVEAELPGLNLKDLEIYVTGGNQLTLKGERKVQVPERGQWHRQERTYGSFNRSLTLPYPVDPEKVDARLEHGVLLIRLTKHESARPRKIPVKAE
jgi:HSP20 family protein